MLPSAALANDRNPIAVIKKKREEQKRIMLYNYREDCQKAFARRLHSHLPGWINILFRTR